MRLIETHTGRPGTEAIYTQFKGTKTIVGEKVLLSGIKIFPMLVHQHLYTVKITGMAPGIA